MFDMKTLRFFHDEDDDNVNVYTFISYLQMAV